MTPFSDFQLPAIPTGRPDVHLSVSEVLSPYIWVFYLAFVVAFFFTPVMRHVAMYFDIVDRPDGGRKIHREPVAYLGGVALFLGWIAGVAVSQFLTWHVGANWFQGLGPHPSVPVVAVLGALGIFLLGLLDDVRHIGPYAKIIGQVLAAGALLYAGIGWELAGPFVDSFAIRLDQRLGIEFAPDMVDLVGHLLSAGLVIALVVFCCNASNLMDGLDGLCGGVTAIIAAGLLALAVFVAMEPRIGDADAVNTDALRVIIGLALLGAALGFVPHNFNPASIFMGDAGSLLLGFICAVMIILLGEENPRWFVAGMIMFALPVLDTALAFARRKLAGRRLFSPDKQHLHHQLVMRGLSVRQAVLVAYGLAIFFVASGMAVVFMRTRFAIAFYLVIFGCIMVAAYKMGMVHERNARQAANGQDKPDPSNGSEVPTAPAEQRITH
jgi:UDP-GlcNAc:undecaprenyl-phosphate GlcNAc-1-phosphate transferase